jgi:hypothetical protein
MGLQHLAHPRPHAKIGVADDAGTLALMAETPLTNSVSPTGASSAGPPARYIERHWMNTVARTL